MLRRNNYFAEFLNQIRLRHILKMILSHAKCRETKTVLDVGCGNGALSVNLSQACQTVGFTIQKNYLNKHIQGKNERLNFTVGDIYSFYVQAY